MGLAEAYDDELGFAQGNVQRGLEAHAQGAARRPLPADYRRDAEERRDRLHALGRTRRSATERRCFERDAYAQRFRGRDRGTPRKRSTEALVTRLHAARERLLDARDPK